MGIKITYTDETTSEVLAERTISDVEIKALGWQMISSTGNGKVVFLDFHDNTVRRLAKRRINEICQLALDDKTHTVLSWENKQLLRTYLDNQNIIFSSVKNLPWTIKLEIVNRTNIKSAAEREAENIEP